MPYSVFPKDTTERREWVLNRDHVGHEHGALTTRPRYRHKLLAEGITTPFTEATEWFNPIVVEPKSDQNGEFNGKVKLCVDFRHLNKYCIREHYFSSSVLDVVQSIQANDAHLFSSFDAWKGYHQIALAEESISI